VNLKKEAIMRVIGLLAGFAALMGCVPAKVAQPSADYAQYCADCHGATGQGDGPSAAGLTPNPTNLAQLSAQNGGVFPTTRVMAQIWGYSGGKGHGVMPQFAPMMDGALVLYDGGDGIETPTPERLVALAEYLKQLQQ
jgi:mono/diheme cytochrome c family protein